MLKIAVAFLLLGTPAMATDCSFVSGDHELFFVTPSLVAVADNSYRQPPYACTTSTLGTGISGRHLSCSDGFDGALMFPEDGATVTFRDETWNSTCPDNTPMDIGMGNEAN